MDVRVMSAIETGSLAFENGTVAGVVIGFLSDLALATNFSYRITHPFYHADSTFRSSTKDFFNSQFVSPMSSGEVDLVCCEYYYVLQRAKHATILLPISTDKFRGFFVQPGITDRISSIFYAPFGITVAIVFYTITLFSVIITTCIYWKTGNYDSRKGFMNSFLKGSWWIVIAYSLKNYTMPSRSISMRIIAIITSLFFYIIHSTYSAFLLSILTSSLNPIRNFDQLLNYGYSIYGNPSISLTLTNHSKYAKYHKEMSGRLSSFQLAVKGGHVHVDHANAFSYFGPLLGLTKEDLCTKISAVRTGSGISTGLYLRKNASQELRENINRGLARMGDAGLLYRFNRLSNSGLLLYPCSVSPQGYIEMGMGLVGILFETYGVMFGCSFILFLSEISKTRIKMCRDHVNISSRK